MRPAPAGKADTGGVKGSAALHEYQMLDAPPPDELRAVVRVAAAVAGVPAAALNLLDEHRQYQIATVGTPARDCARADSMCVVRLSGGRPVQVPDARADPDYRANPWVTGEFAQIRFYAEAPLITPDGHILGTLCVFDTEPGEISAEQMACLEDLAGVVVAFFERRRRARAVEEYATATEARKQWAEALLDGIDVAVIAIDDRFRVTMFNRAAQNLHEPDVELGGERAGTAARFALYEPDGLTPVPDEEVPLFVVLAGRGPVTGKEMVIRRPRHGDVHVRANARPLLAPDGAVTGAVVALQNYTAEHARRRLVEEARSRLAAANAELRRSNADLTHFAGAVSHDLVAPLAAVSGYLELLADELPDGHPGHERVEAATKEVRTMRDLIDDLLRAASGET